MGNKGREAVVLWCMAGMAVCVALSQATGAWGCVLGAAAFVAAVCLLAGWLAARGRP